MTTPNEVLEEEDGSITDEFVAWIVCEVLMPILILIGTWLYAQYAFDIHHPFLSTFGSGDLLPIATLVLLGASAEMFHFVVFTTARSSRSVLSKHMLAHLVTVVILAFSYGGIKGKGLQLLDESTLSAEATGKLQGFATLTISLTVLALIVAFYSKNRLLDLKVKAAREKS
ncbi:hypothetical protein [Paraburkholderia sp. DHOC27]|uniref:hypothetical protein n=1 Tax=Paraburkholderia sp. DHOC27 TaxID=2303330 RepID=UPI000E3B8D1D|nr:hypothetical protein [Paraburkholderia sp. DHOC27]RFU45650.1 hypothetical protein D0B32_23980 [Paraburkholderia sp. DHOC27]